MESNDATRADGDLFAGLRVAARALRLVAQLEVAEAGKLHAFAALERSPNLLEERLHHVLGFALVQANLLKEKVCQLGLRQRHQPSPLTLSIYADLRKIFDLAG